MRFDRFTSHLQNAISDAQSMAVGRDNSALEPVHLMLSILDQQGSSLKPMLAQAGFNVGGLKEELTQKLEELPSAIHPVVRTHPATGKKSLYVNNGFVGKIVELSEPESSALLKMLYDHVAYSVNIQCRVNWEPNTVVFWDNRIVQHYAAFDYAGSTRKGYRVTIKGEAPTL